MPHIIRSPLVEPFTAFQCIYVTQPKGLEGASLAKITKIYVDVDTCYEMLRGQHYTPYSDLYLLTVASTSSP